MQLTAVEMGKTSKLWSFWRIGLHRTDRSNKTSWYLSFIRGKYTAIVSFSRDK